MKPTRAQLARSARAWQRAAAGPPIDARAAARSLASLFLKLLAFAFLAILSGNVIFPVRGFR